MSLLLHKAAPTPFTVERDIPQSYGLVGVSDRLHAVISAIAKVADAPSTVLIVGESGTGKELVARALHKNSSRRGEPFVAINCATIRTTLIETELFGYEKGAFTGAVTSKPGRVELADGGTLFLDAVGELPLQVQAKLLNFLQYLEFERVGGIRVIKVNVRIICSTHRELAQEIQSGNFREDLFHRLNVVPIRVPALRERGEDIPHLIDYFVGRFNERLRKRITGLTPEARACLISHSWPGNIRELQNVIERAILMCDGETIKFSDLPMEFSRGSTSVSAATNQAPMDYNPPTMRENASLKELVREEVVQVERSMIVRVLAETEGNITETARRLKISRKSLQMKLMQFGLRDRQSRG